MEKYTDQNYFPQQFGGEGNGDLGYYQYANLNDMINNFMFEKTGDDTNIGKINRNKVAYHFQRTIQELNYDVLRTTNSFEIEMNPETKSVPLPQNFVNLIQVSYLDNTGKKHPILRDLETTSGQAVAQQDDYTFMYTDDGQLIENNPTVGVNRFQQNAPVDSTDNYYGSDFNDFEYPYNNGYIRRYGANPQYQNTNGRYVVDEENGMIYFGGEFSNVMSDIIIVVDYISDGLEDEANIKVNKLVEEATYKTVEYRILSNRFGTPDYLIRRVKKEADAITRNSKIRLMNLNFKELSQTFRGQAKWIK